MIDPFTTNTTASSVSASRNDYTNVISVSARPRMTFMYPELSSIPLMRQGYDQTMTLQGYNFDTVTDVYLSGVDVLYGNEGSKALTNYLSVIELHDPFGSLSGLSAHYPPFSAHKLEAGLYKFNSANTMLISICATHTTGKLDVILKNPAGYGVLSTDLGSGRYIDVRT